jgi:hypothetical protein
LRATCVDLRRLRKEVRLTADEDKMLTNMRIVWWRTTHLPSVFQTWIRMWIHIWESRRYSVQCLEKTGWNPPTTTRCTWGNISAPSNSAGARSMANNVSYTGGVSGLRSSTGTWYQSGQRWLSRRAYRDIWAIHGWYTTTIIYGNSIFVSDVSKYIGRLLSLPTRRYKSGHST